MDHDLFQAKPTSLMHTLAEHFLRDAQDFVTRFDTLWEHGGLMHKMGRTKSFVDLLMAVECALKAHAFLSLKDDPADEAYRAVRTCSHNISSLVNLSNYMEDRTVYERLAEQLTELQDTLTQDILKNTQPKTFHSWSVPQMPLSLKCWSLSDQNSDSKV